MSFDNMNKNLFIICNHVWRILKNLFKIVIHMLRLMMLNDYYKSKKQDNNGTDKNLQSLMTLIIDVNSHFAWSLL